ncbi:hypothetical protein GQ55_6G057700 [Panicum hallii var. hallii]|uniref:Tyrosinase copper-binding domain-containing protein n=1 Tax=Panicum hallii var. hallii TaxID=1504633 RepID=A0A2T7D4A3_9POAL|nr:hypothetical protein GQ55_6G057700 [Panicum hallii var. hallii]
MHGGRMASAGGATSILVLAPAAAVTSSCPSALFFNEKKKKNAAATRACHGRWHRATPCRATTSGRGEGHSDGLLWLPQSDLLAGLTGVAAFPGLALADVPKVYEGCGAGESLVTDDLLGCDTIGGPPCQPPAKAGIQTVNFYELPPPKKVRVRRPAHELGPDEVRRYRNALAEMKERNVSDPSSFAAQAAIHEAYCDGHYHIDPTERNGAFDVHFSWLFAPWHRMYIYFYERMVNHYMERDGSGGGFALPYWNWDAPAGMAIPAINLSTVYNQMIRTGKGARCFLGDKFCSEASFTINEINERPGRRRNGNQKLLRGTTSGSLERMAHTAVHVWTGNPGSSAVGHDGKEHKGADMGFLGSAGRDPLFYSHHANVDRLWHLWSTKLGGAGCNDPEWLDTSFVFCDFVDGTDDMMLVRIRVRDVLDTANLGYTYAEPDKETGYKDWVDSKPTRRLPPVSAATPATKPEPPTFPKTLKVGENVVIESVPRQKKPGGGKEVLEVLVIEGIDFDPGQNSKFDVAINAPSENAKDVGPRYVEYAGSFAGVRAAKEKPGDRRAGVLAVPIDDVLADVGVGDGEPMSVVIVPREGDVKITSAPRIEFQAYC